MHKACWLQNLYSKLGLLNKNRPTQILGDNEGSLEMAKNPQSHKQSKHIKLYWHWIYELTQGGVIAVKSVWNPDQTADVLMKALPYPKYKKHMGKMGLASVWGGVLEYDYTNWIQSAWAIITKAQIPYLYHLHILIRQSENITVL